ncbi:MAG: T9SS type A sorting domain-containing protein [FCB group bacterium]
MKKILAIFILFIANTFLLTAQESIFDGIDYYRAYTNYIGSAYNGYSILVYGEGGIIVRSLDGGEKWRQTNLDDAFKIMSITNIGQSYFGVFDKQYIIKSNDDGATWQKSDFGDSTFFYKIMASGGNLYCMSKSNVILCDQNLNKIKDYHFDTDTSYYNFTITSNNLIYSGGHGKLGIINLQNDSLMILNLHDLGICINCPIITNLFSDNNLTYFQLNNDCYQYDGKIIQSIYSPINFGCYTANNNEIFELYNTSNLIYNLDSLYFLKIDKQTKQVIQFKEPGNDRYISNLSFNDIKFLTQDTIIAVGHDKLIYMSFNRGKNWQLKSHLSLNGIIKRNDDLHSFSVQPYAKLVKTADGGVTWLPQTNYEVAFANDRFKDIYNNTVSNFRDIYNGFFYIFTLIQFDTNFVFTNDGCETVNLKSVNKMIGYPLSSRFFITLPINNYTLFLLPTAIYGLKYNVLYLLNDTLGIERSTYIDSSQIIFCDKFKGNELYAITVNYKSDSVYYSLISSKDSGNTWLNELDFNLPKSDYSSFPISKINDNIIISYMHKNDDKTFGISEFYRLNVYTKKLDKILSMDSLSMNINPGILCYKDKAFINGVYYLKGKMKVVLFENDDFENHPSLWKDITPSSRYANLVLNVQKDSLIFISAYDSLMHSEVLWFAKPQTITSVEGLNDLSGIVYLSEPSPNPAQNYTKVRIYWDMSLNIEQADIAVYDVLGTIVSSKNQFVLNKINSYSGELLWNIQSIPSGVYFIVLTLNNSTHAVPVIVLE